MATVRDNLHTTADNLMKWAKMVGFTCSPEKANCTMFSKRRKTGKLKIRLDYSDIGNKVSIKMLGVIFNNMKRSNKHLNKNIQSSRSTQTQLGTVLYYVGLQLNLY